MPSCSTYVATRSVDRGRRLVVGNVDRFVVYINNRGKNHVMIHIIDGCARSRPPDSYDGSEGWSRAFASYHDAKAFAEIEVPRKHDIRICKHCSRRAGS